MAFLPVVAAVASVAGPVLGGITQARMASYQAKVASNNAKAAQENAAHAAQASAVRTEQEGLKAAQRLSHVTTELAANNIDTGTGSAATVQQSQHELGMQDVATVAGEGALRVYGYEQERSNFAAQAEADRSQVVPDIVGGVLKGVGSLASNAGALGIGGGSGGSAGGVPISSGNMTEGEAADWGSLAGSGGSTLTPAYSWMGGNDPHDWDY